MRDARKLDGVPATIPGRRTPVRVFADCAPRASRSYYGCAGFRTFATAPDRERAALRTRPCPACRDSERGGPCAWGRRRGRHRPAAGVLRHGIGFADGGRVENAAQFGT